MSSQYRHLFQHLQWLPELQSFTFPLTAMMKISPSFVNGQMKVLAQPLPQVYN